jgi:hypothetical protein
MTIPLNDAQMRARAIARWEGEGGALVPENGSDAVEPPSLQMLTRLGTPGKQERARPDQSTPEGFGA